MNNFTQSFNLFLDSFKESKTNIASSAICVCFEIDPKHTLLELYKEDYLFKTEFLNCDLSIPKIPEVYRLLFKIIKANTLAIEDASKPIQSLSKYQILQGAANLFERDNAEVKFNQWLAEKNSGILPETLRQSSYNTRVGIPFQELLRRFYFTAPDKIVNHEKGWPEIESELDCLLYTLWGYQDLKDAIELHLFFEWQLESENNTLIITPSIPKLEGSVESDLAKSYKLKYFVQDIDEIAEKNLDKAYLPGEFAKKNDLSKLSNFIPDNEIDMQDFIEAVLIIDHQSDFLIEREMAILTHKYFPGIEELETIKLDEGKEIDLRKVFRIVGYLAGLSKKRIEVIDSKYISAAQNKNALGEKADFAKNQIAKEDCLIKMDYQKLRTVIDSFTGYGRNYIDDVLQLFIYSSNNKDLFTRTPFLKIGNEIMWLPNMVAHVSFAENLIEVLLAGNKNIIHRLQTNYFEQGLNNLLEKLGCKIIKDKRDKEIFTEDRKKRIGDFDILAYFKGNLIVMELKLTNTRNSIWERKMWRDDQLRKAKKQLDTIIDYIENNNAKIKEILGLNEEDQIKQIHPYIISNSLLFDQERFGNYLKINYFTATHHLNFLIEAKEQNPGINKERINIFIELLNKDILFSHLYVNPPVIQNSIVEFGDFRLSRPGISY